MHHPVEDISKKAGRKLPVLLLTIAAATVAALLLAACGGGSKAARRQRRHRRRLHDAGDRRNHAATSPCPPSDAAKGLTGAGASFPFPLYSKWVDQFNKQCGDPDQLPVRRLRRGHLADNGEDRRLRRLRRHHDGRPAEGG